MAEISSDFERFLLANFPDEYRRATAHGVKEDVITAIKSRLEREYQIWCSVPEWIKAEYRDNLPDDVINGNRTVREFIAAEAVDNKVQENEPDPYAQATTDMAVSLLALGYTANTVSILSENRIERQNLANIVANGGVLTEEQKMQWAETRARDFDAIKDDWKTNQPEKYFMHLLKNMSRLEGRRNGNLSEEQLASLDMKELAMAREIREYALMFESGEVRSNFINYFRGETQQAALGHLDDKVLGLLVDVLAESGIKIEAKPNDGRNDLGLDRDSLAYELREQFIDGLDVSGAIGRYSSGPNLERSNRRKGGQTRAPVRPDRGSMSV